MFMKLWAGKLYSKACHIRPLHVIGFPCLNCLIMQCSVNVVIKLIQGKGKGKVSAIGMWLCSCTRFCLGTGEG
jgi:hypothetical protein